jgi:flagellar export protein FliJ
MKRFEFRLQAVLTLRQRSEQAALEIYGRAIQARQAAADRLAVEELELCDARRIWLNALADGCAAVRAAQMLGYCHLLEERMRQCEQALHLADVDLNHASQMMLHSRQQREAVENLLARQRQSHDRHLRDEERKLIDDLVNRRPPVSLSGMYTTESIWN